MFWAGSKSLLMENRKISLLFLASILLLGLTLRIVNLKTNFIFGVDQAEDMYKFKEIAVNIATGQFSKLPLVGEPGTDLIGSQNTFNDYAVYSGALFLYLVTPFAFISNFDPSILVFFFSVANLLGVILIYLVVKKLSGGTAGIFASLLYSVNFYMSVYSRAIWTPSLVPVFFLIALYLWASIKEGRAALIPAFLFFSSAISQLHDSGYYYLFFFIILAVASKVKIFSKERLFYNILAFLIPLAPTIIYETATGFRFIKFVTSAVFVNFSDSKNGLVQDIFVKFWEFFVSVNFPLYFHNFFVEKFSVFYIPILVTITLITICAFVIPVVQRNKKLGTLYIVFILTFLIIPHAAKVFYRDSYFGLYPLFGTTFSTLGAFPIVIVAISAFLGNLFAKGRLLRIFALVVVVFLVLNQLPLVRSNIWENGERKYDYGNKLGIVKSLGENTSGGYSLEYKDPDSYGEGYEFFYIIEAEGIRLPYSYNGATEKSTLFHKYSFGKDIPSEHFAIVGRRSWGEFSDTDWNIIGSSGEFKIYKQK